MQPLSPRAAGSLCQLATSRLSLLKYTPLWEMLCVLDFSQAWQAWLDKAPELCPEVEPQWWQSPLPLLLSIYTALPFFWGSQSVLQIETEAWQPQQGGVIRPVSHEFRDAQCRAIEKAQYVWLLKMGYVPMPSFLPMGPKISWTPSQVFGVICPWWHFPPMVSSSFSVCLNESKRKGGLV